MMKNLRKFSNCLTDKKIKTKAHINKQSKAAATKLQIIKNKYVKVNVID